MGKYVVQSTASIARCDRGSLSRTLGAASTQSALLASLMFIFSLCGHHCAHRDLYNTNVEAVMEGAFTDVDKAVRAQLPLIIAPFAHGIGQRVYNEIPEGLTGLKRLLDEGLESYNESNATMDLVLFEDAMSHVCRISRSARETEHLMQGSSNGNQSMMLYVFLSLWYLTRMDDARITV